MSQSFVEMQEKKDGNPRRMTTFVENSKYIERCEFEMTGNNWVQTDRKICYKKLEDDKN